MITIKKDIFISYKDNDEGAFFAEKLCKALTQKGFSVYFNPDEHKTADFTEKIRVAVENCKDFVLVVSKKCLDALMSGNENDWVRFELLTAKAAGKNIVPVMLSGVKMPSDFTEMPEKLQFLPKIDNIEIMKPQQFESSPLAEIISSVVSKAERDDVYRDIFNCNENYDVNNDFKVTLEKAENGDYQSMYEIANMYMYAFSGENGDSERSFAKAYYWFKKLSDADCEYTAIANAAIAKLYYRGVVPREKQSFTKALEYHKKASVESGYSKQQCAYMLSVGLGCDFDFDVAEKEYLEAVEKGDNIAVSGLANLYKKYGKFDKAAKLYEGIMNTFPKAAYELGCLYMTGAHTDPPKPDGFRAAFYFQHAINIGHCEADVYFRLGKLYFEGSCGFMKDFVIAQQNFQIAADMGHVAAQYMLAYMFEHGHNEVNLEKALYYHCLAADQGDALSPTHAAILYQLPELRNYHKAFHYASLAASHGEKEGEFVLGNLLFFGRGCEPDTDKAYTMYKRSYEHGFDPAGFMLEKLEKTIGKG